MEALETSKMMQSISIPLACLPELGGQAPVLKTLCPLVARYREMKLELSWKLSSCWLAVMMLADSMQVARGEIRHQWSYPAVNSMNYSANIQSKICPLVQ